MGRLEVAAMSPRSEVGLSLADATDDALERCTEEGCRQRTWKVIGANLLVAEGAENLVWLVRYVPTCRPHKQSLQIRVIENYDPERFTMVMLWPGTDVAKWRSEGF